jgi:uncharacterized protein with von Willebrand factor type A (vWA) domain
MSDNQSENTRMWGTPIPTKNTMKTEIIAIVDKSGSMESIRDDSIGGFNAFIEAQRSAGGEARVSLLLFNDKISSVFTGLPIGAVPRLARETYVPSGGTALNDAIIDTISKNALRIAGNGWADKVIVCILTDGQENSSKRSTIEARQTIGLATEFQWEFVFLAANQDAFVTGAQYGFNKADTFNFAANAAGTADAYATMSGSVLRKRGL